VAAGESQSQRTRVVVAGGGVAALEAVIALRDLAGYTLDITMLAPDREFVYQPLSVGDPFALGPAKRYPLAKVAEELDLELVHDGLDSVDPAARTVRTAGGDELAYDALLVATGARREPAFESALTFRGQEDGERAHGLIQDIEGGYVKRIAFVVPSGVAWSLPLYELALMTANRAREVAPGGVEITFVTPEEAPLIVFGKQASEKIAKLLDAAGIAVETGAHPVVEGTGQVRLVPGDRRIECDRVVALPKIVGRGIKGLPSDEDGFIPIDDHARVPGANDVYAAGDGTTFPVKQGGIACQQADTAAAGIARVAGADVPAQPFRPVLRGQLLTGGKPQFMRHQIAGGEGEESEASDHTLWWPPSKIAGVHLAPFLGELAEAEQVREESQEVRLDVAVGSRITI
jgi:sulfide:quinone oxidoreductase